eukprot:1159861-Pelagomonas_calceolata.AAC.5
MIRPVQAGPLHICASGGQKEVTPKTSEGRRKLHCTSRMQITLATAVIANLCEPHSIPEPVILKLILKTAEECNTLAAQLVSARPI